MKITLSEEICLRKGKQINEKERRSEIMKERERQAVNIKTTTTITLWKYYLTVKLF